MTHECITKCTEKTKIFARLALRHEQYIIGINHGSLRNIRALNDRNTAKYRTKSQDAEKCPALVDEIEQDEANSIEAVSKQ